jgi:NADPH-dependent curcumin reductase CurA
MNRQWVLARRPGGLISDDDFRWLESPIPEPGDGEVLVRNLVLSCDPTQRIWMASDSYLPAVKLGEVVRSVAAGVVVKSRNPRFKPGDRVQGLFGWQDWCVARPGSPASPGPVFPGVSLETAMSALGLNGLTAWFGLHEIGRPQPGETVLVSGAAGATGSLAGQIARIRGCRTVGIAGGTEKCQRLTVEYRFDAAVDHRAGDLAARVREACPRGVDIFFDNVGGEALDAALENLAMNGRVVLCGAISRYNDATPAPGPRNYLFLLHRRGRMEGFIAGDYIRRASEALPQLAAWLAEGQLVDRVDLAHGLENAPAALRRLYLGENQGKQLVRIAPDPV